jgi:6-oxo-cyclohex-1-ene-carbonyl-CoA hydrolase
MSTKDAVRHDEQAKDHGLVSSAVRQDVSGGVRYEKRPVKGSDNKPVAGLYNAWITLDNPSQYNAYTTDMVKGVILSFREASAARDVVAVVFTGAGYKAFCAGGNTKEYAEYYAGNPQEYRGYTRLFNDMVSSILACDKPVVCRVNGMRIGGGQEIGMACDFTIAQNLARFGQAGPKHGSAPIGGATDFLPVIVGAERAMVSCLLCEPFSAHEAYFMGLIADIVPALKVDGKYVANPLVETARTTDEYGRIVFGKSKTGDALKAGQELMKRGTVDLSLLDEKVEALCTKLLYTPRLHHQDGRGAAQAEARHLEP